MTKFCVKKPYLVFVSVILVLVLGFVSLTHTQTDLLPELNLPYLAVITTYPGASPEKVETAVSAPLESALGTVSGVENVYSTSAENYSMVTLEFVDDTDMDSALVKVSSALNEAIPLLPEECPSPSILEISMDMMATMYVSVTADGQDIYQVSDLVEQTVKPYLERQEGVANVSAAGLVEQTVQVSLSQSKVDAVNDRLLAQVDSKFAEARTGLNSAKSQLDTQQSALDSSRQELETAQAALEASKAELNTQAAAYYQQLAQADENLTQLLVYQVQLQAQQASLAGLEQARQQAVAGLAAQGLSEEQLEASIQAAAMQGQLETAAALEQVRESLTQLDGEIAALQGQLTLTQTVVAQYETALAETGMSYEDIQVAKMEAAAGFGSAQAKLEAAETQLASSRAQLDTAQAQLAEADAQYQSSLTTYQSSRETALQAANLDTLLDLSTLSAMIYAQNFAMPAGYLNDGEGNQWLLKIGDAYDSLETISGTLLCSPEGIGDVRLSDVADVTLIDNSGDVYARANGEDAVVLSIFKSSTAGTNDVSDQCRAAMAQLESEHPGLHITSFMDQGDYIDLILHALVQNLLWGALLAMLVLLLFLRDPGPTLVVAFSIPFSVLLTIVLMYFSDISINMISLSGLTLGIGMLVDNSVVVIENIYRLRNRGVSLGRAAVQGAKQVTGAVAASTLTTICVFLPLVFSSGLTRELLTDMGLTIAYSLLSSLLVALTVVPTMSNTLLRRSKPKSHKLFDQLLKGYEKSLTFALNHKALPLLLAVLLLGLSVFQVVRTGIVMLPETGSNQVEITMEVPEDTQKEEAFVLADQVMDAVLSVSGVETVGGMSQSVTLSMVSTAGGGTDTSHYVYFLLLQEGADTDAVCQQLETALAPLDCETVVTASSSMSMSELSGGLEIDLRGNHLEDLLSASQDIMEMVSAVEGFENVSNGQEEGDPVAHLVIDRDAAMKLGLTTAQVYQEVSAALQTEADSTSVTIDGTEMEITVTDTRDPVTLDTLLDQEIQSTVTGTQGETVTETHKLREFASLEYGTGVASITRENQTRTMAVTADTAEGYNTTLLSRQLKTQLDAYQPPAGVTVELAGETSSVADMMSQMLQMIALALLFIYLIMVAQFQSLLSPFIVLFTIPLAFTGGMLALFLGQEPLSLMSMMGFLVLAGVVVNNGIVFVDYTNQLRFGGLTKRQALVASGRTRMRPILMTALTTILAMCTMIFSRDSGSVMARGMALVVVGGLLYATLMTLYIVPVMYEILFRRKEMKQVDVGEGDLDQLPDDAAAFLAQLQEEASQKPTAEPPAPENN